MASLICPSMENDTGEEFIIACSLSSSSYTLSMKISHKKWLYQILWVRSGGKGNVSLFSQNASAKSQHKPLIVCTLQLGLWSTLGIAYLFWVDCKLKIRKCYPFSFLGDTLSNPNTIVYLPRNSGIGSSAPQGFYWVFSLCQYRNWR